MEYAPMSIPFPSYGSPMHMPYGHYFSMPYLCPSCSYNSWMPSPPRYFCEDYTTYRELAISKPSPTNNDHFDQKDRSIQKKNHKVIKEVYRVKKDGRLNKNSNLTQD